MVNIFWSPVWCYVLAKFAYSLAKNEIYIRNVEPGKYTGIYHHTAYFYFKKVWDQNNFSAPNAFESHQFFSMFYLYSTHPDSWELIICIPKMAWHNNPSYGHFFTPSPTFKLILSVLRPSFRNDLSRYGEPCTNLMDKSPIKNGIKNIPWEIFYRRPGGSW